MSIVQANWWILKSCDLLINGDSLCSWNRWWFHAPRFLLKENGQSGIPDLGLDNLGLIV